MLLFFSFFFKCLWLNVSGPVFVKSMQILHFFIGFGALVSPLIADPFLSETGCGNHTGNHTESIHHFRSMLRNSPVAVHDINQSDFLHGEGAEESSVHYAFWIMALINVCEGQIFKAIFLG